nr:tyrosine-type recombinase/integrase [Bifidobacterium longum]
MSRFGVIHRCTRRSAVLRHAGLGRRGGSRLLRRNAATRMLEAATPLPTISAVLGHADPDSTRVYMATHRGGMLACVLPVPEGGSS